MNIILPAANTEEHQHFLHTRHKNVFFQGQALATLEDCFDGEKQGQTFEQECSTDLEECKG